MIKDILIASLLIALVAGEITTSLLTFKSSECAQLASGYAASILGNEHFEMFKALEIMSVKKDIYELRQLIHSNDEFSECIASIEENEEIYLDDSTSDEDVNRKDFERWQLRRISTRDLPLVDADQIVKFEHKAESHVYIIDTGIDGEHPELIDMIAKGDDAHFTIVPRDKCFDGCVHEDQRHPLCDCNSHGTHCAGLVVSEYAGYNKYTTLHSVKAFMQSGMSDRTKTIASMNWAVEYHLANHSDTPGIFSQSFGGGAGESMNKAVQMAVEKGIFVVVAARNTGDNACLGSPAQEPTAYAVGATKITDRKRQNSAWGECVNIFAPGENIYSTVPGNKRDKKSGTSMATPLVAGLAAYISTKAKPADRLLTPLEIGTILNDIASHDKVKRSRSYQADLPYGDLSERVDKAISGFLSVQ